MTSRPTSPLSLLILFTAFQLAACDIPRSDSAGSAAEPEGSSLATDDVAYLTRLGLIRGHLEVGMELYEQGMHDHAKRHMKHPADELYAALTSAFAHRGSSGFADELERLATLVQQDADDAAVQQAYASLLEGIAEAESRVDSSAAGSAESQGAVAVNLLGEAAREYSIGVVDGRIEEVHEYQDAYGFTRVAIDHSQRAKAALAPNGVLDDDVRDLESLSELWPELVPASRIEGNAERIDAVRKQLATEMQRL